MSSQAASPVARLLVALKDARPQLQPIFGGYANARGAISLFAKDLAYGVDFKTRTICLKPLLNAGAQTRYDAAKPGSAFQYCGVSFRRLSNAEIADICASGSFRMSPSSPII